MGLKEYLDKTRKTVVCPSGASAVIRKLNSGDFLEEMGSVPGLNVIREKGLDGKPEPLDPNQCHIASKVFLTRGVLEFSGEPVRVVDKRPEETKEGEFSVYSFSEEDKDFLVGAIVEFHQTPMKMLLGATGKEIGPQGARFPVEPDDNNGKPS